MTDKVSLVIMGLGQVGQQLVHQLLQARGAWTRRKGLEFVIIAVADSRTVLLAPQGLSDQTLMSAMEIKKQGKSLTTLRPELALQQMHDALQPDAILVDLTASRDTVPILQHAVHLNCGIVLANKHPLGGRLAVARPLLDYPHLRYEATVGAGLPVISALQVLLDTGDEMIRIEGCLSGTLGYLCTQMESGVAYADAIYEARSLGYTEPDPREDLSGRDVARKALILARTAGWPLEMTDLAVDAMYPDTLSDVSTEEFLSTASQLNKSFVHRFHEADEAGKTLRFVAQIGPKQGHVGLTTVDKATLLGALRGPANYLALYSHRYAQDPLIVSGPGAGPEVTAAGVLSDIIDLALHRL